MLWSELKTYVPDITVYISLFTGAITLLAYVRSPLVRWMSKSRTISSTPHSYVQPPHRRHHRRPLTQPSRPPNPCGTFLPQNLVKSIPRSGRVPIENYVHPRKLVNLWRLFRLNFLTFRTSPKPAFLIADWRFEPRHSSQPGTHSRYLGGFILSVTLHQNENRWHLRRSLRHSKSSTRNRRLVVLASAQDLVEPTAWVRCMVVDTDQMDLPKGDYGKFAMASADPLAHNGSTSYRLRQKNVPDDAIWLISIDSSHTEPCSNWGQTPESVESPPLPTTQEVHKDEDCDNLEHEIDRLLRRSRIGTLLVWLFLGPGVVLLMAVVTVLVFLTLTISHLEFFAFTISSRADPIIYTILGAVGAIWIVTYLYALVFYLLSLAQESIRGRWWSRRESRPLRAWKGGTQECLIMGSLLRRGSFLQKKDWKHHRTSSSSPVPASNLKAIVQAGLTGEQPTDR